MITDAAPGVLDTARGLCPASFSMIHREDSLRDYGRRLYTNDLAVESALARQGRRLLASALMERLPGTLAQVDRMREEVESNLVVQTGPHHRLVFDDDYFSTLALSLLGSEAAGRTVNIFFNCSTVTLEEQNHRGPAWLRTGGTSTRVFDLPRRLLAKRSVVAFDDPIEISEDLDRWAATNLPPNLSIDLTGGQQSAREHLARINGQVFARFEEGTGVATVAVREDFFATLLATSLEEPSLIRRLFDDGRLSSLVTAIHSASATAAGTFVPHSTDLFWAIVGGRVRTLALVDGHLRSERHGIDIPLERKIVSRLLRSGLLIPNLFLIFCLTSIIPAGRALGGSYQAAYHEVFTRLFVAALDPTVADELDLVREIESRNLVGWGHNVIAHNAISDLVLTGHTALSFDDHLGDRPLDEVSRSLAAFADDPRWRLLASSATKAV